METFLEAVQELEYAQRVDKVPAVEGSPVPEANDKDSQETSCLRDVGGNQRDIGDAAFHDAQSPPGCTKGRGTSSSVMTGSASRCISRGWEDVRHEEGPSSNSPTGTRQWWRMWLSSSADVHAGSGTLWYNCMEAMDAPTVGAVLQADSTEQHRKFEQQRGCTLAVQVFRKTPKVTRE